MIRKLFLIAFAGLGLMVQARGFHKGDMVADLNIGIGLADVVKVDGKGTSVNAEAGTIPTFSQKIAFEYGIVQFGKSTIGIGGIISNAYGFSYDTKAAGSYDYTYVITYYKKSNGRWKSNGTDTKRRRGEGIADATGNIDDINIMLKGSYHYNFSKNLDLYSTLAFGVSLYNTKLKPKSDSEDETGMFHIGSHTLDKNSNLLTQPVYYYNDFDHVEWNNGSTHARLAMALNIGVRYYLTENWAINGEFGLTSASFKKDCNVYNLVAAGVSYKF